MLQYIKMAEAIVEPIVDIVAEKEEPPAPIVEPAAPEAKKRGRPSGVKDRAPRKKKVTIVEEPLEAPPPPPEPETPKPRTKPAPKATPRSDVSVEPPAKIEEPPSPRSVMRSASMNILQLRELTERAKKAHLEEQYTKKLHRF